jgi:hypothetical protein
MSEGIPVPHEGHAFTSFWHRLLNRGVKLPSGHLHLPQQINHKATICWKWSFEGRADRAFPKHHAETANRQKERRIQFHMPQASCPLFLLQNPILSMPH